MKTIRNVGNFGGASKAPGQTGCLRRTINNVLIDMIHAIVSRNIIKNIILLWAFGGASFFFILLALFLDFQ